MALTIKEYQLVLNNQAQTFDIPGFDQVLGIIQNLLGTMSIFVSQDSTKPNVRQTFQMNLQGQPVPTIGSYVGFAFGVIEDQEVTPPKIWFVWMS